MKHRYLQTYVQMPLLKPFLEYETENLRSQISSPGGLLHIWEGFLRNVFQIKWVTYHELPNPNPVPQSEHWLFVQLSWQRLANLKPSQKCHILPHHWFKRAVVRWKSNRFERNKTPTSRESSCCAKWDVFVCPISSQYLPFPWELNIYMDSEKCD